MTLRNRKMSTITPPPIPADALGRQPVNWTKKFMSLFGCLALIAGFCLFLPRLLADHPDSSPAAASISSDPWAISDDVYTYEELITNTAIEYGIEPYKDILLCITQVESAGSGQDVMQASESLDLPLDSLNPYQSVRQGVSYFASLLQKGNELGVDLDCVIQSYNYGSGFLDFAAQNGGSYTFELAQEFARIHSNNEKVDYPNPIAVEKNGGYRYNYGNMFYVQLVNRYLDRLHEKQALESQAEASSQPDQSEQSPQEARPEVGE